MLVPYENQNGHIDLPFCSHDDVVAIVLERLPLAIVVSLDGVVPDLLQGLDQVRRRVPGRLTLTARILTQVLPDCAIEIAVWLGSLRSDMVATRKRQRAQRAEGKERKGLHGGIHDFVGRLLVYVRIEDITNGRKPARDV